MYVKPVMNVFSKGALRTPESITCEKKYCPSSGYTSCTFYW